ncbi:hypothetical protein [Arthrobacter sp. CJ23]|uniref:hypothetical protein n=1 Tax=Arthrobacter sp. CJ23 TaxID=2972479 RepID=UPI00215B989E|nr:hypothetical protein [Arthrobacter sp. CJ23]UVJ37942.1 hypothetical protein NVV90_11725 [Arthrobacter sp. CJ23]
MSQQQPPIRSRRELRRARDERLEQAPGAGAEAPDAGAAARAVVPGAPVSGEAPETSSQPDTGRVRRVAEAPVDAVASSPATERSSLVRARDRAALRAIKELADKEEQLSGGGPPTRRQLRLQQLQEEIAPATSAVPTVPGTAAPGSLAGEGDGVNGGDGGSGAVPAGAKAALAKPGAKPAAPGTGPTPADMSVEQALAVRQLITAQVENQTAKLEHIAEEDPLAVDPEILAQQIALAERAAVLNRRAAAKQKLAEQNQLPAPVAADPSAASNLAMVTPLEFVKVPGVDRPVMKPPGTTFVPVITSQGPALESAKPASAKAAKPGLARGRSGVLARAEAAAKSAPNRTASPAQAGEDEPLHSPIAASSAYGLEPLDANTAGLGRAQRNRMIQLLVLALGIVALVAGVVMITSGISR